jgi:polyisoprenyl-phosphate glycosyltransferase
VVPCYNEQEVLPLTVEVLSRYMISLKARSIVAQDSYVYLVDDGSRDQTWPQIMALSAQSELVRGIKLARNFGHQSAILAGMFEVDADVIVTIDADLQDDETAIERMIKAYTGGADVVLGVRGDRTVDTFFKRVTAEGYYRLLNLLGVPAVYNHADYRLLSRRALDALKSFKEVNLFLRGIIPLVGLQSATVTYARRVRAAGVSKYPLGKMIALAFEGVTSFSVVPLRFVSAIGAAIAIASLIVGVWALYIRLSGAGVVPGWASTVIPMYLLGGIQMFFLGILGEYVGKIYIEVKGRPRYLIDRMTWRPDQPR